MSEREAKTPDQPDRRRRDEARSPQPQGPQPARAAPALGPHPVAVLLRRVHDDPNASALRPVVADKLRALQATHGNRYVQRLVKSAPLQRSSHHGVLAREAAAAAGAAAATGTVFKPVVRKTYNIKATTLAKAVARVEAYQKKHGEAGKTEWSPKLDYKLDESGNVKSASVVVTIKVTMPNWAGAAKLSAAAKAEWDRAYKELKDHEEEHVSVVREQLEGLAESLIGKSEAEAKEAFKVAKAELQKASDAIDPFTVDVDTSIK